MALPPLCRPYLLCPWAARLRVSLRDLQRHEQGSVSETRVGIRANVVRPQTNWELIPRSPAGLETPRTTCAGIQSEYLDARPD